MEARFQDGKKIADSLLYAQALLKDQGETVELYNDGSTPNFIKFNHCFKLSNTYNDSMIVEKLANGYFYAEKK